MRLVFFTALAVGGATMLGVLIGVCCKRVSKRFEQLTFSIAAGVMLASAVVGLLLPSLDYGGAFGLPALFVGVCLSAVGLSFFERLSPRLTARLFSGADLASAQAESVLLFAVIIAVHNAPEGLAAGVGFGTQETSRAVAVALGIALQNLPEGMVTVTPLLAAGLSPKRTLWFGLFTGAIEIVGTLLGYCAVRICAPLLPLALAFAGGCMLFVIIREMIPQIQKDGAGNASTYALLGGFCVMLAMDHLLS